MKLTYVIKLWAQSSPFWAQWSLPIPEISYANIFVYSYIIFSFIPFQRHQYFLDSEEPQSTDNSKPINKYKDSLTAPNKSSIKPPDLQKGLNWCSPPLSINMFVHHV